MRKFFLFLIFASGILVFSSCEKKITPEIKQILPDEIMQAMIDLGMPINKGLTPPDITGTYHVSPFVLYASNISSDYEGMQFADFDVTFYDFNRSDLTVKISYVNGPEAGQGLGAYIMGSGNDFTVVVQMHSQYTNGDSAVIDMVMSGTLASDGIKDFYYANFMVDNFDNPNNVWIEEGQGRVIYDQDGFSEKTGKKMSASHGLSGASVIK